MKLIQQWWSALRWAREYPGRRKWVATSYDEIVNLTLQQYGEVPPLGVLLVLSGAVQ